MNQTVLKTERDKVRATVAGLPEGAATISSVVDSLVASSKIPAAKARYIVRAAIDKGDVRTDQNFRLHLTPPM